MQINPARKTKSFTLMELIVVVLIIGVLASISVPQIQKAIENSRQAEAVAMLNKMYKGYKTAIIDGDLYACDNSYQIKGKACSGTEKSWFNPDESDTQPAYLSGHSALSWKTIGFDKNPNYDGSNYTFSYDFLKPVTGWTPPEFNSQGTGSRASGSGMRPGSTPLYNDLNIGVAWRKSDNTRDGSGFFPIYPEEDGKWIFIDMDTGVIYKGPPYQ